MAIEISPDQIWFYPLGTKFDECRSRLAPPLPPSPESDDSGSTVDGIFDGMYVEAFDTRWLATIAFKDGVIYRETLLLTTADRKTFKEIYSRVKDEFGLAVRQGLFRPTGYIWDYKRMQLILTLKETGPLTGIYLILTTKESQ